MSLKSGKKRIKIHNENDMRQNMIKCHMQAVIAKDINI